MDGNQTLTRKLTQGIADRHSAETKARGEFILSKRFVGSKRAIYNRGPDGIGNVIRDRSRLGQRQRF
ncbi:hypothetical protein D3C85_1804350 [compost metagenome]